LSFDLGSLEAARRLLNGVRLHSLAESLGGVETLISHPASMTHASVPAERRAAIGITDGLVRISAGLEDVDDLKEDLLRAPEAVGPCRLCCSPPTKHCWTWSRPPARGSTRSFSESSSPRPDSSSHRFFRATRCCSRRAPCARRAR